LWRASFDADANSYYYRFDSHMTGLILGSAIALTPRPTISPLVATAALGVLIVLFTTARIADARSTITSAELVSALLVLYAVGRPVGLVGTILRHPVAQFIGTRSYAMYLWHFPVIFALDITHTVSMGTAIALAITVGMSELSYRTVEAWSRHVKSREAAVRSAQLRA
jgi:peptidoglycan/LPS O-acetylase OafA/YrhL